MSTLSKAVVGLLIIIILAVAIVSYIVATQPFSPQPTSTPTPTLTASPNPSSPSPTLGNPTPTSPAPTPTPTPQLTEQEMVRDSVMNYIKTNHNETEQFMTSLIWTGGRVTPQTLVGYETFMYYSGGWNFTMSYPVVPQPVYTIIADYKATGVGIPYRVVWEGTWQTQVVNETDFVFAQ